MIFVSHQWLSSAHPDPHGRQTAVLRSTLAGVMSGSLYVEPDAVSIPSGKALSPTMRQQIGDGYLFLDWYAIPQITAREEGVNEDVTRTDAALAVQSIPAYVELANVFIALVPALLHTETGMRCNYVSWQSRGWCHALGWISVHVSALTSVELAAVQKNPETKAGRHRNHGFPSQLGMARHGMA